MSDAIDLATKESYQLVDFVHGGGAAYFTDWTSDVSFGGNTYLSTPDMEVKLPENNGLLSSKECRVAVPLSSDQNDFTQRASTGIAHAPITMTVREVLRSTLPGPSQTVNTPFTGQVEIVKRHHRGRTDKLLFTAVPITAKLDDVSMGLPAHHLCVHNLGDRGCKVNLGLSNRTVPVAVVSIDGRLLTVASNSIIEAKADRFFHRGFIRREGLNISIREWRSADPLAFELARQAPTSWIGNVVDVVAGCDKSIDVCRSRFDAESEFLGAGIAMPPYHPNWENAP